MMKLKQDKENKKKASKLNVNVNKKNVANGDKNIDFDLEKDFLSDKQGGAFFSSAFKWMQNNKVLLGTSSVLVLSCSALSFMFVKYRKEFKNKIDILEKRKNVRFIDFVFVSIFVIILFSLIALKRELRLVKDVVHANLEQEIPFEDETAILEEEEDLSSDDDVMQETYQWNVKEPLNIIKNIFSIVKDHFVVAGFLFACLQVIINIILFNRSKDSFVVNGDLLSKMKEKEKQFLTLEDKMKIRDLFTLILNNS